MEEEIERLSEIQPQSKIYNVELRKIREEKLKEIRKILDALYIVIRAFMEYKKRKDNVIPFMEFRKKYIETDFVLTLALRVLSSLSQRVNFKNSALDLFLRFFLLF